EEYAVRQNNGHNAVWLDVEQLMEQESVISLVLRRQTILRKARIGVHTLWLPLLRIRRVRHNSVHKQRIIGVFRVRLVEPWPVVFQAVAVAGNDIVCLIPSHY